MPGKNLASDENSICPAGDDPVGGFCDLVALLVLRTAVWAGAISRWKNHRKEIGGVPSISPSSIGYLGFDGNAGCVGFGGC
jgi:hypothetical protein